MRCLFQKLICGLNSTLRLAEIWFKMCWLCLAFWLFLVFLIVFCFGGIEYWKWRSLFVLSYLVCTFESARWKPSYVGRSFVLKRFSCVCAHQWWGWSVAKVGNAPSTAYLSYTDKEIKIKSFFWLVGKKTPIITKGVLWHGSIGIFEPWALGKPLFGFCSLFCCQYKAVFLQSPW